MRLEVDRQTHVQLPHLGGRGIGVEPRGRQAARCVRPMPDQQRELFLFLTFTVGMQVQPGMS